ncbi:MAG: Uma2 family endonuclease [Planctomycetes bacterium]|nr:Uma2 family endonuclease [Planctomycetota bacterium]
MLHLVTILQRQVEPRKLGKVAPGPVDVELSRTTVVHPDVVFVATANLHRIGKHIVCPPDLTVEHLSPSNPGNDLKRKMHL